ncbi:MAG: protein adenylyltransferase SelO family protein [Pseudobdellovibrionaceae bacterium]
MAVHKPIMMELGSDFYDPVQAASFPEAKARFLNQSAAQFLALDELQSETDWARRLHRFESWPQNIPKPLALRYHGHQFRHYNPDLGDGRGFLFAQFQGADGKIYDLGTKGSGQTPYSRSGDGRLTLKGAFREALATEMLESLGVLTSRTFCFFETGEHLERSDEPSPTRSAVLTRMNLSHIRIGTFQRLAFLKQPENILKLLRYTARHYFPEISSNQTDLQIASQFLSNVSRRLAHLSAQYMVAGFVHGVLNSDNMNVTGESFDYGPYRFLPHYDPNFTAAYFDQTGLYCFGRQPSAIHWNVAQLAGSLQSALPDLQAKELIEGFGDHFSKEVIRLFFHRVNLQMSEDPDQNDELISQFFLFLSQSKIGYEQLFFDLHSGLQPKRLDRSPAKEHYQSALFTDLRQSLENFKVLDVDKKSHPYFQRTQPCTLIIDELESLWSPIALQDDWSGFERKIAEIRSFRGLY